MQILEEKLGKYCRFSTFNSTGSSDAQIGVIAAIDEENTQTGLTAVLSDICKETRKILAVPITIGIGHSTQDLGMICESYKDAVNALRL